MCFLCAESTLNHLWICLGAGPAAAVTDMQDTLPLPTDICALPVPPDAIGTRSPDVPASAKRESYQIKRGVQEPTLQLGDSGERVSETAGHKADPPSEHPAKQTATAKSVKEAGNVGRENDGNGTPTSLRYSGFMFLMSARTVCILYMTCILYLVLDMVGGGGRALHHKTRPVGSEARERKRERAKERKGQRPRHWKGKGQRCRY